MKQMSRGGVAWGMGRFMGIAEQMGRVLQRTSISVNIKERLDFSCALFGPDGSLVANAPHLPVHLGAMSEAVRFQAPPPLPIGRLFCPYFVPAFPQGHCTVDLSLTRLFVVYWGVQSLFEPFFCLSTKSDFLLLEKHVMHLLRQSGGRQRRERWREGERKAR